MPELLPEGLPERPGRSRIDFSQWADGQAWQFVRGEDYRSTTESFRYLVRRWAKANGFVAETRPLPAAASEVEDPESLPQPAARTQRQIDRRARARR